jgi:hypothetical protein
MPVRSRAARFLVVVALLAVTASVAGTVVATSAAGSNGAVGEAVDSRQTTVANGTVVESINQTFRVEIRPDGDARWTVRMRATVANDSDAPLSDLAAAYERGETPYLSLDSYRAASDQVGTAVGRSMEITGVSERQATVDNRTVSMEIAFTWTNFGEQANGRLAVRDVFNGTAGKWFPGLESFQTLIVTPPDGYDISSVDTQATLRNRTLRWYGPVSFGERTPYVIYIESSGPGASPTPSTSTTDTTGIPGPDTGESGLLVPAVVVLLVGLLAVLAVVASRSDRPLIPPADEPGAEASDGGTGTVDPPPDGAAGESADGAGIEAHPEPEQVPDDSGPAETPADDGTTVAADDSVPEDDIDEQLLSDEERVERLLERNGGRMKQANIVSETDWSNAKVSQLLSSMAEEGRIEKLRIGRENLISFPDEDK